MADWVTAVEGLEKEIKKLEEDVKFLRKDNLVKAELIGKLMLENIELAKRPVVYCAKRSDESLFMVCKQPMVFLSIENATQWFATVPIFDVQFEPYTGEQKS